MKTLLFLNNDKPPVEVEVTEGAPYWQYIDHDAEPELNLDDITEGEFGMFPPIPLPVHTCMRHDFRCNGIVNGSIYVEPGAIEKARYWFEIEKILALPHREFTPVTTAAALGALKILNQIYHGPMFYVTPTPDGGIKIDRSYFDRYLEIEVQWMGNARYLTQINGYSGDSITTGNLEVKHQPYFWETEYVGVKQLLNWLMDVEQG